MNSRRIGPNIGRMLFVVLTAGAVSCGRDTSTVPVQPPTAPSAAATPQAPAADESGDRSSAAGELAAPATSAASLAGDAADGPAEASAKVTASPPEPTVTERASTPAAGVAPQPAAPPDQEPVTSPAAPPQPAAASDFERLAMEAREAARDAGHAGKGRQALPLYEEANRLFQLAYADENDVRRRRIASNYASMAAIYLNVGDYQRASAVLADCERIFRQLMKQHQDVELHRGFVTSVGVMAAAYREMNQLDAADAILKEGLSVLLRQFPEMHGTLASIYSKLALASVAQDKLMETGHYVDLVMKHVTAPEGIPSRKVEALLNCGIALGGIGESKRASECLILAEKGLRKFMGAGDDHPALASINAVLGGCYKNLGEHQKAIEHYLLALRFYQGRFPDSQFPAGARDKAVLLMSIGDAHLASDDLASAEKWLTDALALSRRVYEASGQSPYVSFLVNALGSLGQLRLSQHRHDEAIVLLTEAEQLLLAEFPSGKSPFGHTNLSAIRQNLGWAYCLTGDFPTGIERLKQDARALDSLAEALLWGASEAEALNFLVSSATTVDLLLSAAQDAQLSTDEQYAFVWRQRGLVTRTLGQRRAAIHRAGDLSEEKHAAYLRAQRELAALALQPRGDNEAAATARKSQLETLAARKEQLERDLAADSAQFRSEADRVGYTPAELAKRMPAQAVLVDFRHYLHHRLDARESGSSVQRRYLAFVIPPGGPVQRVDLGRAQPIDEAIDQWRTGIDTGGETAAASQVVAEHVWKPLTLAIPADCKTIYICTDGRLAEVPWAAIPDAEQDVLLRRFAFATVPHPQFLCEQWDRAARPSTARARQLLAVGNVDYDGAQQPKAQLTVSQRRVLRSGEARQWPALKFAEDETESTIQLAGAGGVAATELSGRQATVDNVVQLLPTVTQAHFATHGFFVDESVRAAWELDERAFETQAFHQLQERTTATGRNPMLLSGLILSGANQPPELEPTGLPEGDVGMLTAETISTLDLSRLSLAVLSACDTGRGEVANGEGVRGLQRAFHLGGTRNVVASLWRVDDQSTAVLMQLFYHALWEEGLPPLAALRSAQLSLYDHPELLDEYTASRGSFDLKKRLPVISSEVASRHAATRQWASFALSGPGDTAPPSAPGEEE